MSKELSIKITQDDLSLSGVLSIPENGFGFVIFVHGSGSSRFSPRNQLVARALKEKGIGTLLFDLLTKEEEMVDMETAEVRFDISLLAKRLYLATNWIRENEKTKNFPIGYFGASTGAAAALVAASRKDNPIKAVVSRGGRPDLAGKSLAFVEAPTLFIVGGNDTVVIDLNKQAMGKMQCEKKLAIIEGATHLFEEPGAIEKAADLAVLWFQEKLKKD